MKRQTDIAVIGLGLRGMWLSSQLSKQGFDVTWLELADLGQARHTSEIEWDEYPTQWGELSLEADFAKEAKAFVEKVIEPREQEIARQIVTPHGVVELAGPGLGHTLSGLFAQSGAFLLELFKTLERAAKMESEARNKLVAASFQRAFQLPPSQRWCLEWLGSLRSSRVGDLSDLLRVPGFRLLNAGSSVGLLDHNRDEMMARGAEFMRAQGVHVVRGVPLVDIGLEGSVARGVEIGGAFGFLHSRYIVLCTNLHTAALKLPRVAKILKSKMPSIETFWVRCGFTLRPESRPAGILELSSFVMDPLLPLENSNFGILRWRCGKKMDSLTVWMRVKESEMKMPGQAADMMQSVEKNLRQLFPRFEAGLISMVPFESYFEPGFSLGNRRPIYSKIHGFEEPRFSAKHFYFAGPENDPTTELQAMLFSEKKVLEQLSIIREKELKRDRKVHSARNGRAVDATK